MIVAFAAIALAAALPRYLPGDAFVYSDGRVERVLGVDRDAVIWGGLGETRYRRSANPVVPILSWTFAGGEGRRTVGASADALWPIAPGRTATFSAVSEVRRGTRRRRSMALWKCRVGAAASITVRAGTFDTLPIQCERFSPATMRLAERVRWDWSPEIGHYVRRSVTLYYDGSTSVIELSAALTGGSATLPRLTALARAARTASTNR